MPRKRWLLVSVLLLVTLGAVLRVVVARYDFGKLKPGVIRAVKDATGRDLELTGDLRVSIGFSVALAASDVSLANAPWGSRPQMLSAERLEARVGLLPLLLGDLALQRVTLTGVDVFLERDAEGRGNWEFARARPAADSEAPSLAADLVPDEVRVERVQVSLRQGEATRRLSLELLELSPGDDPSTTVLRAKAEWDGQPVVIAGRVGALSRVFSHRRFPVDLEGTFGTTALHVAGAVDDVLELKGLDLKFEASGENLGDVGHYFGKVVPAVGPFEASARLHGSANEFVLDDLAAKVGRSDFRGSGKVEAREPPKISLALASSLVDLTPLLAVAKRGTESPAPGAEGARREGLFPDDPLPFDVLGRMDADIVLDAKSVQFREARIGEVHLDVEVEGRALRIERLEASYEGAKLSGTGCLAPGSPPRAAAKFLVQDFDLGGFVRDVGGGDRVRGHLDIAADLESEGESVKDLVTALDGTLGVVMGKGRLSNYLDLIAVDLTDKVLAFWGRHRGENELKCAVVQFDVRNGLATSKAFVFDTDAGVLLGGGTIDVGTEEVDFLLVPRPRDPSVTSLATKLRVGGSITAPTVAPDPTALAKKGVKFLSVFALGPAGVLVPFVNLGADQAHPCDIQSVKELGLQPPPRD